MAIRDDQVKVPSSLDEWIGEIGEDGVVAVIEDTRQRIADGLLPGFIDPDSLLAHWNRGRPRA